MALTLSAICSEYMQAGGTSELLALLPLLALLVLPLLPLVAATMPTASPAAMTVVAVTAATRPLLFGKWLPQRVARIPFPTFLSL
jgi:hypothetical protein